MAADEVRGAFQVAAVEMQVAATEGGGGDFEDGVGGLLDLGIGPVFDFDLCMSVFLSACHWRRAIVSRGSHP